MGPSLSEGKQQGRRGGNEEEGRSSGVEEQKKKHMTASLGLNAAMATSIADIVDTGDVGSSSSWYPRG